MECCISGIFYNGFPQVNYLIVQSSNRSHENNNVLQAINDGQEQEHCYHSPVAAIDMSQCSLYSTSIKAAFYRLHQRSRKTMNNNVGDVSASDDDLKEDERWEMDTNKLTNLPRFPSIGSRMGKEAFIFIPGFNSCLNNVLGVFGQFLTLGGYPIEISPWLFNWPGGSVISYFQAQVAATSTMFMENLHRLIQELQMEVIT